MLLLRTDSLPNDGDRWEYQLKFDGYREMRRGLLERQILPKLGEPVRYAAPLAASLRVLIESVKAQGLEGLVAKRLDSRYEAGLRSGAWQKMRVNRAQEFVIGGYTAGTRTFDALVFGYYEGDCLMHAARTRNGFTPIVREQLFKKFRELEIKDCPIVNLPEAKSGRWGAGLTAAKMKECRWLKPVLVAQIEFLEWSGESHLRHTSSLCDATTNRPATFGGSSHPQAPVAAFWSLLLSRNLLATCGRTQG